MQHNYNQKSTHLLDLSEEQIIHIRKLVDTRYSQTILSIMVMWYNHNNDCTLIIDKDFIIVHCFPSDEDPFWIAFGWINDHSSLQRFILNLKQNNIRQVKYCPDFFVRSIINSADHQNTLTFCKSERSYSDYIYSIEQIRIKEGGVFKDFRWELRDFEHIYGGDVLVQNTVGIDEKLHLDLTYLHDIWIYQGTDGAEDNDGELIAMENFFKSQSTGIFGQIYVTRLFIKNKLVGLSISERIDKDYVLSHFQKSNLNISHINKYIFSAHIDYLSTENYKFVNYQNDLGLEGLRSFKLKLRPCSINSALDFSLD